MGVSDTFLQKVWKQASNLPKLAAACYSLGQLPPLNWRPPNMFLLDNITETLPAELDLFLE